MNTINIYEAWRIWAESFLHNAEQLPYRVALIAFMAGALLSWFAAREWFVGDPEEVIRDGEAGDDRI